MKLNRLPSILSITVIIVLLLSLINTAPVFADDETPPPPATEESVNPATKESTTSETDVVTKATNEPVDGSGSDSTLKANTEATSEPMAGADATQEPTVDSEATPEPTIDEAGQESGEETDITIADALIQAPEGTDIVIVNADGESEPLASQKAEDIAATADPMWCPNGVAPVANTDGCSDSFTTMTALITWLKANDPDADGTIWIEDAYDSAAEGVSGFDINGGDYTNLDQHSLTIQGGWDGVSGSTALTSATATSSFTGDYLSITNWVGDVTINNIFIDEAAGYNYFDDFTAGLYVDTAGSINLDEVTVQNSEGDGAVLDSGGNVTITNSSFNDNGYYGIEDGYSISSEPGYSFIAGDGLYVEADGNVTLNMIYANDNAGDGAIIYGYNGGSVLIEHSQFNGNGQMGDVFIYTYYEYDGPNDFGAEFDMSYYGDSGLYVESDGNLTLNDVQVNNNAGDGAELYSYGEVNIINSSFDGNGYVTGLFGEYWGYDVMYYFLFDDGNNFCDNLNNDGIDFFTLIFNPCESTDYLNFYMPFADFNMAAYGDPVYGVYNSYDISQRGGTGLDATADGNIVIDTVSVDGNSNQGAYLESYSGDVTILNSTFNGNGEFGYADLEECLSENGSPECYYAYPDHPDFGYDFYVGANYGNGLFAEADGALTIMDSYVNANYDDGAILDGTSIFIEQSEFDLNGYPVLFSDPDGMLSDYLCNGFYISLCGPIPLPVSEIHVDVSGGFDISTDLALGATVYIDMSSGAGLDAEGDDITLNDVSASGNMGGGAILDGYDSILVDGGTFASNGVGLNGGTLGFYDGIPTPDYLSDEFPILFYIDTEELFLAGGLNVYSGDGLYAGSGGDITLMNVTADDNFGYGAELFSDGNIFVSGTSFSGNGDGTNLFAVFYADVYLSEGSGFAYFEFGNGDGLYADTLGNITIANIVANDNLGNGVTLLSGGNIFVSSSTFEGNGDGIIEYVSLDFDISTGGIEGEGYIEMGNGDGLYADANGDVTLSYVNANNNAVYGAEIYSSATNSVFVEYSQFNSNGYGSPGTWAYEVFDFTLDSSLNLNITPMYGETYYGSGLYIDTAGNVTLSYVEANNNYQDGAEVYSNGGYVHVYCGTYDSNGSGTGDGYGVNENDAFQLGLFGPEITGNANGDQFFFSDSLIVYDNCLFPEEKPGDITGYSSEGRSCAEDGYFFFLMINGDWTAFPCPINDVAHTRIFTESELPAPLPDELITYTFQSALDTDLFRDGEYINLTDREIVVSFLIPDGVDPDTLTILYWNDNEWIDLDGAVTNIGPNGEVVEGKKYFQKFTNHIGTFVLVTE